MKKAWVPKWLIWISYVDVDLWVYGSRDGVFIGRVAECIGLSLFVAWKDKSFPRAVTYKADEFSECFWGKDLFLRKSLEQNILLD